MNLLVELVVHPRQQAASIHQGYQLGTLLWSELGCRVHDSSVQREQRLLRWLPGA
jgi:hypothetical protein